MSLPHPRPAPAAWRRSRRVPHVTLAGKCPDSMRWQLLGWQTFISNSQTAAPPTKPRQKSIAIPTYGAPAAPHGRVDWPISVAAQRRRQARACIRGQAATALSDAVHAFSRWRTYNALMPSMMPMTISQQPACQHRHHRCSSVAAPASALDPWLTYPSACRTNKT